MATQGPTNLPAFFNVDADFRGWGSGINTMLAALGLVQTADTGQINWTTVLKPAASAAVQGYEIWRFADSLQSTAPVYIKIEYGASSNSQGYPGLWTTVGSASDGAGNITGRVGTRQPAHVGSTLGVGGTLPTYCSGSTGELQLASNVNASSAGYAIYVGVLRPRDGTGAQTSEGVIHLSAGTFSGGGVPTVQFIPAVGIPPSGLGGSWPALSPGTFNRNSGGSQAGVCPLIFPLYGNWRYARTVVYVTGDFTVGTAFTATMQGGTHTFMPLGANYYSQLLPSLGAGGAVSYAMAWE